jgi:hypothetical protein
MLTRLTAAVLVRFSTALLQGLVVLMPLALSIAALVAAAVVECWLAKPPRWVLVPTPSLLAPMLVVVALVGPPFVEPCLHLEDSLVLVATVAVLVMEALGAPSVAVVKVVVVEVEAR